MAPLLNIKNGTKQRGSPEIFCERNGDEIQLPICRFGWTLHSERIANFDAALALSFFNKPPKPRIRENWGRWTRRLARRCNTFFDHYPWRRLARFEIPACFRRSFGPRVTFKNWCVEKCRKRVSGYRFIVGKSILTFRICVIDKSWALSLSKMVMRLRE